MSLSINKNFSVPQLRSPDNYHDWLVTLRTYLETHDLWDFICEMPTQLPTVKGKSVEGEKKEATSSAAPPAQPGLDQVLCEVLDISPAKLRSKRAKARGSILATLTPSIQASLHEVRDPAAILNVLREKYLPRNRMRLFKVSRDVMNLRLQPREDLDHFFHRVDSLVDELNAHDDFRLPAGTIIAATIAALPPDYRTYVEHVEHTQSDHLDLATIRNGLRQEETKIHASHPSQHDTALLSESSTRPEKEGKSSTKQGDKKTDSSKTGNNCTFCKGPGHSAIDCRRRLGQIRKLEEAALVATEAPDMNGNVETEGEAFYALMSNASPTGNGLAVDERAVWYFDTGATSHFTCRRDWLHDYATIPPHPVVLGNNRVEHAVGRGRIRARTIVQGGANIIELEDVLYVPTFGKNLVSARRVLAAGHQATLDRDRCTVVHRPTGKVVLVATPAPNGLLSVALAVNFPADHAYSTREMSPTLDDLHRRFAHVGEKKVRTLARLLGVDVAGQKLSQCSTCVRKTMQCSLI